MSFLQRVRDRLGPGAAERAWLGAAAAVLGLGAGAGVAAFRGLHHLIGHFAYGKLAPALAEWGSWTSALIPVAGGLVAGLIVAYVIGEERHHGVAGIIEAIALDAGRLRWRRAPAKAIGAAISIGTGASVGPEDPSVQIGANLGSWLGSRLGLPDDRVRSLVASGAAAGVAAAFGAPIAGVFFALEVILADFAGTGIGLVLVTSVIAALTSGTISGGLHPLHVPSYALRSLADLPLYLLLGALLGPFAALYVRAIDGARGMFERSRRARWLRPAIAGAVVGLVALRLPQVRGVDYGALQSALDGASTAIAVLLVLGLAKILLTAICVGAGFPGGVFAPAMFTGAVLGAAFGTGVAELIPASGARSGAFAVAGMAAFLAASVHAPMTAVLLVFEITGDYDLVGAAMCAVAAASLGARLVERESVYSRALVRKGFRHRALAPIETQRMLVEPGSPCDGKRVRDVPWPRGCVVARIRRDAEWVAAHGDVEIRAGDEVVAVTEPADQAATATLCRAPGVRG